MLKTFGESAVKFKSDDDKGLTTTESIYTAVSQLCRDTWQQCYPNKFRVAGFEFRVQERFVTRNSKPQLKTYLSDMSAQVGWVSSLRSSLSDQHYVYALRIAALEPEGFGLFSRSLNPGDGVADGNLFKFLCWRNKSSRT